MSSWKNNMSGHHVKLNRPNIQTRVFNKELSMTSTVVKEPILKRNSAQEGKYLTFALGKEEYGECPIDS